MSALRYMLNKKGRELAQQGAEIRRLKVDIDCLVFILRDLVTDEEIGLHETGELWLRAKRAVADYDAAACCGEISCAHIDGSVAR